MLKEIKETYNKIAQAYKENASRNEDQLFNFETIATCTGCFSGLIYGGVQQIGKYIEHVSQNGGGSFDEAQAFMLGGLFLSTAYALGGTLVGNLAGQTADVVKNKIGNELEKNKNGIKEKTNSVIAALTTSDIADKMVK